MEKTYWLGRKRAAMAMARSAVGAEARLIHYDLAGRYSVKAAQCLPLGPAQAGPAMAVSGPLRLSEEMRALPDGAYYGRLQVGAEYLAAQAADPDEREEHLKMARIYSVRARDAEPAVGVH